MLDFLELFEVKLSFLAAKTLVLVCCFVKVLFLYEFRRGVVGLLGLTILQLICLDS